MAEEDWGLWPDLQEKRLAILKNLKPDGAAPLPPPCTHHNILHNKKMVEDDWGLWADQQEKSLAVLNNLKSHGTAPVPAWQHSPRKPNPASSSLIQKPIRTHQRPTSQHSPQELSSTSISLTQKPIRTHLEPQEPNSASISLTKKSLRTHLESQEPNSASISLTQKPIKTHLEPQEPNSASISLTQKPTRTHLKPQSQHSPQEPNAASVSFMNKLLRAHLIETIADLRKIEPNSSFYSSKSFEDFNLRPQLLKGLYSMGFNNPSKIQERMLSLLTADPPQNLRVQSLSGSGKTIAAILAALHRVDPNLHYPHVLLLSPLFELAVQAGKVAKKMARFSPNIAVHLAIRGENLERGHRITEQFLIGTPGKVFDWAVRYRFFDLKKIRLFLLDEADLMISVQGHEDQTIRIHKQLSKVCQKMLFSTAFSDELMDFAEYMLAPNPDIIKLKKEEEIPNNVKQYYIVCKSPEVKPKALDSVCGAVGIGQIVIFCRIKATAALLVEKLSKEGHKVALLSQEIIVEQRTIVLNRFREGKEKILIAINAYAWIIDVEQVIVVINYDLPVHFGGEADYATYLRCIGRTGRFGKTGLAINLIDGSESMAILKQIESHFGKKMIEIDYNEVDLMEMMAKR